MNQFIGSKLVNAKPMSLGVYNDLRGWDKPANESASKEGYLVEYLDGGEPNTDKFDNYISWSPKDVFDKAYNPTSAMRFGDAVLMLKAGKKVARAGWNGKGMFLFLVQGSTFKVNRPPLLGIYPEGTEIDYRPHIDMKTADGQVVPWIASQSDTLVNDWMIVS